MMAPLHYSWHVKAVSLPGPDTDLALWVSFDQMRFLFGSGEGIQRTFVQRRLATKGLTAVFIGDGGSKQIGGLPGLIMTVCDAGIPKLDIVGPSTITHFLATTRASLYRHIMEINTYSHPPALASGEAEDLYSTHTFAVQSIALRPPTDHTSPSSPSDFPPAHERIRMATDLARRMFKGAPPGTRAADFSRSLPMPLSEEIKTQMIYICQAPPVNGKFDNEKAKALKVPKGSLRGELVRGQVIEFDDPDNPGTIKVVKPEDVVSSGHDGAIMAVVNCSEETLPVLLASPAFEPYQTETASEGKMQRIQLIVHRVPTSVWRNEEYIAWIKSFGSDTQHLIADTQNYRNDAVFRTSAYNTLSLSLLDDEFFPLPMCSTPSVSDSSHLPSNAVLMNPSHSMKMNPLGKLEQLPNHEKDVAFPTSLEGAHEARRKIEEAQPEFAAECVKAREAVRGDPRWDSPVNAVGDDIVVTTLGTGSAIPSKHRNVSCSHLDIPGMGGVLLDSGEGTLGQLRRRYGFEGLKKVYEDLRVIFISHMHADHHLGLQAVLEDRFKNGVHSKLYLVAPMPIAFALSEAGAWCHGVPQEALDNLVWIDNYHLSRSSLPGVREASPTSEDETMQEANNYAAGESIAFTRKWRSWPRRDILGHIAKSRKHSVEAADEMKRDLGLMGVRTPSMRHRGHAWGLVLHHESGWKVAYSGDTMPCDNLIRAGQGATLLIHEATLEEEKADLAKAKGHSTFSQAIEVGREMRASHILLNHFSQRYPKLPKSRVRDDEHQGAVSISFDLMSVRVGEMWRMKYYMDAVEILFPPEEEDELDVEVVKKAVKGDRNATVKAQPPKAAGKENGRKPAGGKALAGVTGAGSLPKRQASPSAQPRDDGQHQAKKTKSESSEDRI